MKSMNTLQNTLITALAPIIWGTTYLVTSEALPPGRPFIAALFRTLPAGLILIACSKKAVPAGFRIKMLMLSALNIGAFQALLFVAAYRLPGGIAAVIGALQPLVILMLIWMFARKRPGLGTVATALVSVAGMALVFGTPGQTLDPLGLAAAGAGMLSLAVGTYLTKRWTSSLPLPALTGWQLTLGGLMLAPFALWIDPPLQYINITQGLAYLYLCLCGALLSYALWFRGILRLTPTAVSSLGLLSPLTAILLGWYVLGEFMTPLQVCAILLVLSSVVLMQRMQHIGTDHPEIKKPLKPKRIPTLKPNQENSNA
jgi:probable blue pigment (indigoidine) exporter